MGNVPTFPYVSDIFMASKDDLDVEIEENLLKITVKAHQDKDISENDYIIREISRGQMTRMLSLGDDIDVDSAKTSFKDGVGQSRGQKITLLQSLKSKQQKLVQMAYC